MSFEEYNRKVIQQVKQQRAERLIKQQRRKEQRKSNLRGFVIMIFLIMLMTYALWDWVNNPSIFL